MLRFVFLLDGEMRNPNELDYCRTTADELTIALRYSDRLISANAIHQTSWPLSKVLPPL